MTPVSDAEFLRLFRPWGGVLGMPSGKKVLVGVSGGADSMALAVLSARLLPIKAVIVDHGIRQESAEEAALTESRLRKRGIDCLLFRINPENYPKGTGMQERARAARFRVFEQVAAAEGAAMLLLAHHLHDQDETVYMRWRKQSFCAGLAGIQPEIQRGGMQIVRPLLCVPPERLRATLQQRGIRWCEDPSNQSRHYERVRVRQDITPEMRQKMRFMAQLARCQLVFQRYQLYALWQKYFTWHQTAGWIEFSEHFWQEADKSLAVLMLRYLVAFLSGASHLPSFRAAEQLYRARLGTLGGVVLKPFLSKKKKGAVKDQCKRKFFLAREMRGLSSMRFEKIFMEKKEEQGAELKALLWSGTWCWTGEKPKGEALEIRPLGLLKKKIREEKLPLTAAQALPSLWCGKRCLGAVGAEGLALELKKLPFKWAGGDFCDRIGALKLS